jgi:hypothetical protein
MMEIVVAIAIIGILFTAVAGVFITLGKGVMISRTRTVATNLAQERIESLKDISYSRLRVTSISDYTAYNHDNTFYPPENGILVGDIAYQRNVLIQRVKEDGSGILTEVLPDEGDTGLKKITVTINWQEAGQSKNLLLSNLRGDPDRRPLDGTISGIIRDQDTSALLSQGRVSIVDNLNWNAITGADGAYAIKVPTGTYQVRASLDGYWSKTSASLNVGQGTTDCPFNLKKMATGSTTGYVFINDHAVISKVVSSTITALGDHLEWVELYNPTTFPITINGNFNLTYKDQGGGSNSLNTGSTPPLQIITNSIPPNAYYLIANTGTVVLGSYSVTADAKYSGNFIHSSQAGALILSYPYGGTTATDKVGWKTSSTNAPDYEYSPLSSSNGIDPGSTHVRCSRPFFWYLNTQGSAFDSDNNSYNFLTNIALVSLYYPRTSTTTCAPMSGYPAYGAIISCNDGISMPVTAAMTDPSGYRLAYFQLPSIATGTWTISMFYSSTTYHATREIDNIQLLTDGQSIGIPNATTSPAWPVSGNNYAILNSTSDFGFIAGTVKNGSTGIPGIKVEAGTNVTYSTSTGKYLLPVPSGVYSVLANAGNLNANYISQIVEGVTVNNGLITDGVDLDISPGGAVGGRVISDSGDYLPNVLVNAYDKNNNEVSSAQTLSNGIFTIPNLPTSGNNYTIKPSIDDSESNAPSQRSVTVTAGITQWTDTGGIFSTFTITSAFGVFSGTVTYNNVAINSGVLIIATTATITSAPPDIDNTLRTNGTPYYGAVSHADGSYSLQVRGGTYNYNIYAWYATSASSGPQLKSRSNKTVNAGGATTVNLTWP